MWKQHSWGIFNYCWSLFGHLGILQGKTSCNGGYPSCYQGLWTTHSQRCITHQDSISEGTYFLWAIHLIAKGLGLSNIWWDVSVKLFPYWSVLRWNTFEISATSFTISSLYISMSLQKLFSSMLWFHHLLYTYLSIILLSSCANNI